MLCLPERRSSEKIIISELTSVKKMLVKNQRVLFFNEQYLVFSFEILVISLLFLFVCFFLSSQIYLSLSYLIQAMFQARRPGTLTLRKEDKRCWIIDITDPGSLRKKRRKSIEIWNMKWHACRGLKKVNVVPVVVALGTVSNRIPKQLGEIGTVVRTENSLENSTVWDNQNFERKLCWCKKVKEWQKSWLFGMIHSWDLEKKNRWNNNL